MIMLIGDIHNKHTAIMSVYNEVVSYNQTYKTQLFIINEHGIARVSVY